MIDSIVKIVRGKVSLSDGQKATYRVSFSGLVTAASATDIFTLTGSGSKTIRILAAEVSGSTSAGSGVSISLKIIKRSTANSGGTSTSPTAVPHDSSDSGATAVARAYTANPTVGTEVGILAARRIAFPTVGAVTPVNSFSFGNNSGRAAVLRGTAEVFAINFNSTSITSPVISGWVEFTEE